MRTRTRLIVTGLLAAAARAAGPDTNGPKPAATGAVPADATAIAVAAAAPPVDLAPLLNDHTALVARVDLSRVDLPAAAGWVGDTFHGTGGFSESINFFTTKFDAFAKVAQARVDALVHAGVTHADVVVTLADPPATVPHVMVVTPGGLDAAAVGRAVGPVALKPADFGGGTLWTLAADADYARNLKPAARPELVSAVADAGDAVMTLGLSVSDDERKAIAADPALGRQAAGLDAAASPLKNVRRVALRVDTANGPHVRLAADADDAAALKAWVDATSTAGLGGPNAEPDAVLPATVAGRTVTVDLRQPQFDRLAAAATPALERARRQALRAQSMVNIRVLLQASMMYANENHGAAPASVDVLGKAVTKQGVIPPSMTTNPQRPELGAGGYVFVPLAEGQLAKAKRPAERLAVYEAGDFADGVSVGFWDGHVEFMTDHAKFDALLAAAAAP